MGIDNNEYGRKRRKRGKPLTPQDNGTPKSEKDEIVAQHSESENIDNVKKDEGIEKPPIKPIIAPPSAPIPNNVDKAKPHNGDSKYRDNTRRRETFAGPKRERPRSRPESRHEHRPIQQRSNARISIIIPAYNEEENIKPLLEQFNEVISRAGNDWEVILVNDGSSDKTLDRAREAANRFHWLKVVTYSNNRGLTAALNTGFKNARGSVFVFYPADLQYHANDIPKMVAKIDRGADVVTGWKQGKYKKRFVSFVYNRFCRALFGIKIHDMNSVKAFKKEVVENIPLRKDWHRYIVVLAADAGFVIDEVKVALYPRHSGQSKFGTSRIIGGVLDLLSVKFQLSFTKKPLRLFGTWGIIFLLVGLIFGLDALYLRFFTEHGSRAPLYIVILFVISGLLLFAIGFLAEVIVSLREEIESLKLK